MDSLEPGEHYWIDTHIHLAAPEYQSDLDAVLARNTQQQILKTIQIGSGYGADGLTRAIAIGKAYPHVWSTVGIHPNEASDPWDEDTIRKFSQTEKIVAIGETGLDYYRTHSQKSDQWRAFIFQINLAKELKKPLVIHNREAGADCLKILQEHGAQEVGGVFHCYSEDAAYAQELAKINFRISITGNVTYKNNQALRDSLQDIPLEQIMLETDGPYLSPQSKRGQRNESIFLLETAATIAEIKKISLPELAKITSSNAEKLFNLNSK